MAVVSGWAIENQGWPPIVDNSWKTPGLDLLESGATHKDVSPLREINVLQSLPSHPSDKVSRRNMLPHIELCHIYDNSILRTGRKSQILPENREFSAVLTPTSPEYPIQCG